MKTIVRAVRKYGMKSMMLHAFSLTISDCHVVSFEKAGRTWLRVMLAKLISMKCRRRMRLDTQYMSLGKKFPNILFSHAGANVKDNRINFSKVLRKKKIIFLVRDPRDLIVSLYHEYTKRQLSYSGTISDFIRSGVMHKVRGFMRYWTMEMRKRPHDFLLIRYEDMKNDTEKEMRKIMKFLRVKISSEMIERAVAYGSIENMKKLEEKNTFKDDRMKAKSKDKNSVKVRKGKVGSYKEELSKKDIQYINKVMRNEA